MYILFTWFERLQLSLQFGVFQVLIGLVIVEKTGFVQADKKKKKKKRDRQRERVYFVAVGVGST